ncbi:hypothetical protein [Blastomonas sp. SL216]|uniref:hypothetical protein n=1 Tax=Blastomonas sp. SL216 TaxID=2995169 RepID=UPI00237785A2|nr:hypothetical protein OU999_09210 [Blastomonas sp. SL216]
MLHDRTALRVIADLLRSTGHLTEQVGSALCADEQTASRNLTLLQDIDLLAQRQVAIAEILESEDLSQSLANCRLEWIASAYHPASTGRTPDA